MTTSSESLATVGDLAGTGGPAPSREGAHHASPLEVLRRERGLSDDPAADDLPAESVDGLEERLRGGRVERPDERPPPRHHFLRRARARCRGQVAAVLLVASWTVPGYPPGGISPYLMAGSPGGPLLGIGLPHRAGPAGGGSSRRPRSRRRRTRRRRAYQWSSRWIAAAPQVGQRSTRTQIPVSGTRLVS